jgi:CheY-like chemotaxis protein
MELRHKILLVDDDPSVVETYKTLLENLPSKPEVATANSGSRAMAMLEGEPYRLLVCDLKMPRVDGLQVLSIVRRKYPELRTVALTGVADEQFRSRVYALGVDLYWHKPGTEQEMKMFLDCLESLLGQEADSGFRGVQSKSLMDIIQLECMSQSSSVLRITNGLLTGKIWIQDGEVVDAEAGDLKAESAFYKILSWKTGTFETLPPDPDRARGITKSYNALLLESAQTIDEVQGGVAPASDASVALTPLAQVSQMEGVEFVLTIHGGEAGGHEGRGLENPERMVAWTRHILKSFAEVGDRLHAGPLEGITGIGPQRHVTVGRQGDTAICAGWKNKMTGSQVRDGMKKVLALWAS